MLRLQAARFERKLGGNRLGWDGGRRGGGRSGSAASNTPRGALGS